MYKHSTHISESFGLTKNGKQISFIKRTDGQMTVVTSANGTNTLQSMTKETARNHYKECLKFGYLPCTPKFVDVIKTNIDRETTVQLFTPQETFNGEDEELRHLPFDVVELHRYIGSTGSRVPFVNQELPTFNDKQNSAIEQAVKLLQESHDEATTTARAARSAKEIFATHLLHSAGLNGFCCHALHVWGQQEIEYTVQHTKDRFIADHRRETQRRAELNTL